MPIKEQRVEPVGVNYACDEPNCTGEMVMGNTVLTSSPPQYPHKCNVCGARQTFFEQYPRIEHRAVAAGSIARRPC